MATVTSKDKKYVREIVESDSFDYGMRYATSFENIKDKKFHDLRNAYLSAVKELADYIGLKDY